MQPLVHINKNHKLGAFLIEVILAFSVFMTVGVACVIAFNQIGQVAVLADQEQIIARELQNAIRITQANPNEIKDQERILTPSTSLPNLTIKVTTTELTELYNNQEQQLGNIYHITATAYWGESSLTEETESLDTYILKP